MTACTRTMAEIIQSGNIERAGVGADLALYMGSGDFGGCFDSLGLQPRAFRSGKRGNDPVLVKDGGNIVGSSDSHGAQPRAFRSETHGDTVLMHADFYHRGAFGLDYHTPIGRIAYQTLCEEDVQQANQCQNIWDGTLQTRVQMKTGEAFAVTAAFHPYARDYLGVRLEKIAGNALPKIVYTSDSELHIHYNQTIQSRLDVEEAEKERLRMHFTAGNASGWIEIQTQGASIVFENGEAVITPEDGAECVDMLLWARGEQRRDAAEQAFDGLSAYFESAKEGWHKRWGDRIPDMEGAPWNKLFLRCVYHMLCSWSPSDNEISPPNGWSGNGWPFEFPQDVAYIHPVFLKLGMYDIAKAKVEFYHRFIDTMRECTQRIYGADGVMWAWIFPIGPDSHILADGAPNTCHYEIHNAVYPAKMAYDTAMAIGDEQWARSIAWPIIRESARFYASIAKKDGDTWSIQATPSMGQDEFGGANAKNYLCSLYSARYTFRMATEMKAKLAIEECDDEAAKWTRILEEGLAFDRLENARLGVYQTCEADDFQLGRMKHPIELLPYTALPWDEKNVWEKAAYEKRYQLCVDGEKNFFHGWTLAWILLAEANMGDESAFTQTALRMPGATYTDAQSIQIYETSKAYASAYYVTSEGLVALAVLNLMEGKGKR